MIRINVSDEYINDMSIRQVNQLFRLQCAYDHKAWPLCGQFDLAERAIRRARKFMQCNGATSGLEYYLMLDDIANKIIEGLT